MPFSAIAPLNFAARGGPHETENAIFDMNDMKCTTLPAKHSPCRLGIGVNNLNTHNIVVWETAAASKYLDFVVDSKGRCLPGEEDTASKIDVIVYTFPQFPLLRIHRDRQ